MAEASPDTNAKVLTIDPITMPDSAPPPTVIPSPTVSPSPSYLLPMVEVMGLNGGLWAYNRYVADYGFARINASTMAANLKHGWVWDEDQFSINQFGHPYQGSFYYSAARFHGHGFYASTAYTALGSLQWEYFMEAERPSYNDLLTTTLGGAMLGEVSFRVSEVFLDPRATGLERVGREVLAAAANPVNGIGRLFTGESFRVAGRLQKPPLRDSNVVRFSTGAVLPYFSSVEGSERTDQQRLPRGNTEILLIHGDPFAARTPYDYFLFNLGLNFTTQPIATISARAQLHKVEIYRSTHQRGMLLLGQNFDYLDIGIYKLGVSGIGGGYAHVRYWGQGWFHTLHMQAGVIPIGAVSSEFFRTALRDYNLGAGAYTHTRITIGRHGEWFAAIVSDRYWIRTRSGAKGDELIGHARAEIERALWRSLGFTISLGTYDRTAYTRDHGTRAEATQEVRLLLTYGIL
jgi:hypothetical protein